MLHEVEMTTLALFLILHRPPKNLQLPDGRLLLLLDGWVLTGSSKDKYNRIKLISAPFAQISANQQAISIKETMPKLRIHSRNFLTMFKTQRN